MLGASSWFEHCSRWDQTLNRLYGCVDVLVFKSFDASFVVVELNPISFSSTPSHLNPLLVSLFLSRSISFLSFP